MSSKQINNLIQKEIDGTITSEEKEKLNRHLAENPEAKKAYEVQTGISRLLDDVPPVDPPEDLKKRIMNVIDMNRYSEKASYREIKPRFSGRGATINPKMAFVFGLGLIVGFLIHMALKLDSVNRQWIDSKDFIGTVGRYERARFNIVERTPLDLPGMRGQITLSVLKNLIGCEVRLSSEEVSEIQVNFDSTRVNFYGFEPYRAAIAVLENGGNFIRIKTSENARYVLFFQRESEVATPIEITVFQMGRAVYRRKVDLTPSD
jgi:hypothetical protein